MILAIAAAAAPLNCAFAQATGATLRIVSYEAPVGIVEVTGLRRWSLDMLRDSVRVHRPGLELHDSACAVVLRQFLGFPDAQVITRTYIDSAGAKPRRFVSIKVVEPGDAGRTKWATTAKADTFRVLRPSYASLILGATDVSGSFSLGPVLGPLQFGRDTARFSASISTLPSARRAIMQADAARLHAFLMAHSDTAAWRVALEAVRGDGEYANRFAAVVVLAGFGERDATWHAVVDALRDGQEAVRQSALAVLQILPSRTVDWTPVVPGLRALLGGTNVAATEAVLRTLARSRVSPALAGPLLHGNAEWVLAHLRSRNPAVSSEARALLVQLNGGNDLGDDATVWERWLGSLPVPRS